MSRTRRSASGVGASPELRRPLGDLAAAIVRMNAMDPVTTELVRMQCAKHHDCGT